MALQGKEIDKFFDNLKSKKSSVAKKMPKDSKYSPQGSRYLSHKEQKEKSKDWPIMQKGFKPKDKFQELAHTHFKK